MKPKRRTRKQPKDASTEPWVVRALYWVICGSVLAISLVVSVNGRDPFRLPKDLLFRAEFIVVTALLIIGLLLGQIRLRKPNWKDPVVLFPTLIVVWTFVTTLTSTNRALSWPAFIYVLGAAIVFLATVMVAQRHGTKMMKWVLWGGVLNALLYLSQALAIWNPFPFVDATKVAAVAGKKTIPLADTAFLGNANDLGSYLVPVFVVSLSLAMTTKGRRLLYSAITILLGATLAIAGGLAALGAIFVATAAMAAVANRKAALRIAVALVVFSIPIFAFQGQRATIAKKYSATRQLQYKLNRLLRAADESNLTELLRGRLLSFEAAFDMFRDRPITGVGPGVFGWEYYSYKIQIVERGDRSEAVRREGLIGSFEEAHNDHLEVLAETGLPGLLLLLSSLCYLSAIGLSKGTDDPSGKTLLRVEKLSLFSLAMGFAALAVFLYPLQLSSSVTSLIFIVGICIGTMRKVNAPPDSTHTAVSGHDAPPWIRLRGAAAVAVACVAAFSIHVWCIRWWHCNIVSKQLESALFVSSSGEPAATMVLRANLERSLACLNCLPRDESLPIVVASTYSLMGRDDAALETYDDALALQKRPEYYFNRAVTRLNLGDVAGAMDDYTSAVRFSPAMIDRIKDHTLRKSVALSVAPTP